MNLPHACIYTHQSRSSGWACSCCILSPCTHRHIPRIGRQDTGPQQGIRTPSHTCHRTTVNQSPFLNESRDEARETKQRKRLVKVMNSWSLESTMGTMPPQGRQGKEQNQSRQAHRTKLRTLTIRLSSNTYVCGLAYGHVYGHV